MMESTMASNNTRTGIRRQHSTMEEFDKLPKCVRKAVSEYPFKVTPNPSTLRAWGAKRFAAFMANNNDHIRKAARLTYGPDHPQAQ